MKVVESVRLLVLKTILVTLMAMITFMSGAIAYKEWQVIKVQRNYIHELETTTKATQDQALEWYKQLQEARAKLIVSEARVEWLKERRKR